MIKSEQLITADWLITATESGVQITQQAAIHIGADGTVIAVGADTVVRSALDNTGVPYTLIELGSSILAPGLINAHTHAAMTLLRGAADDMPLMDWLQKRIWPMEGALVDEHFVTIGTQIAAAEMLMGGTTTCTDMYFYSSAAAKSFLSIGMRAQLALPVIDFPSRYAADADGYLAVGLAARDELKGEALLTFALGPHAPYTVSDVSWQRVNAYAAELGMITHTHLQETAQEVVDAVAKDSLRPAQRLQKLGTLGPDFVAAHGVHLNNSDIELLAKNNASVVHCPSSNLKLASGIAPVVAMMKAGINVALGTDGAASNNRLDMFEEMRLAALLAKVQSNDASAMNAVQAFTAATLNGARALGLSDVTGSLEVGKAADIIAISLNRPAMSPIYDPVSHFVYVASRDDVTNVWVNGYHRVVNRALHANAERVLAQSHDSAMAIATRVRAMRM
jgi:5-methylthioadenosine/S-adenosylhomocysteine deaminase